MYSNLANEVCLRSSSLAYILTKNIKIHIWCFTLLCEVKHLRGTVSDFDSTASNVLGQTNYGQQQWQNVVEEGLPTELPPTDS